MRKLRVFAPACRICNRFPAYTRKQPLRLDSLIFWNTFGLCDGIKSMHVTHM
jgi:hypothetical protein